MSRTHSYLAVAALLLSACAPHAPLPGATDPRARIVAEPWPEADRLFYNNPDTPQWKGADVANSVALDNERVLWVFGDTLLAEPGANACERFDEFGILVHNSLALQQGTDPTTARIAHFWGGRDGKPQSFFEPPREGGPGFSAEPAGGNESWYWMGGVTVLHDQLAGDQVLVFLMHARSTVAATARPEANAPTPGDSDSGSDSTACAGLNFEILGWDARIATITPQSPDQWQWRDVTLPRDVDWNDILVGSSTASVGGGYLYAWSAGPAALGGNPVYLARWPVAAAAEGDLSEPQWHTAAGWQAQSALREELPEAIVADGNNEISVAEYPWANASHPWWWLQSSQVMNSSLCYRSGDTRFSFGECRNFMEPPELRSYPDSSLLVYAVKFHPALTGQGDGAAIATYVVNSCSLADIQQKCDLYYPRFIRLRLR